MLDLIRALPGYHSLLRDMELRHAVPGLGLLRAARLPLLAAIHLDLNVPILFITDRTDRALMILDELSFWLKGETPVYFPEPNPLFYEQASWGTATRRDRLQALASLAQYHFMTSPHPEKAPVIVAPVRAVMTLRVKDFARGHSGIRPGSGACLSCTGSCGRPALRRRDTPKPARCGCGPA